MQLDYILIRKCIYISIIKCIILHILCLASWHTNNPFFYFFISAFYFFISAWIVCLQQQEQNFLNSNRLGVLCRFFWVIYLEIPVDSLLTLFWAQQVHSKITLTRISLPLAMNLLFFWFCIHLSIFVFDEERNDKEIKVDNSKSNFVSINILPENWGNTNKTRISNNFSNRSTVFWFSFKYLKWYCCPQPNYSISISGLTLLILRMELNYSFNSIEACTRFRVSRRTNPPFLLFFLFSNLFYSIRILKKNRRNFRYFFRFRILFTASCDSNYN